MYHLEKLLTCKDNNWIAVGDLIETPNGRKAIVTEYCNGKCAISFFEEIEIPSELFLINARNNRSAWWYECDGLKIIKPMLEKELG